MAFFWDTVCYVGWLPILACAFVLVRQIVQRTRPARPWLCIAVGGLLAILLALPFLQHVLSWIPGTLLRSPSRQLYLTTFALSLGLGAATHWVAGAAREKRHRWIWGALGVGLSCHFADLGAHARAYIKPAPTPTKAQRTVASGVLPLVTDGRVAIDYFLPIPWNREIDDVGFFDSIMLARPYQALLAMNEASPRLNIQAASGSAFNARSLAYAAARLVITTLPRSDLPRISTDGPISVYSVPHAHPRVQFLPQRAAQFLPPAEILARLRDAQHNLVQTVMLEPNPRLAGRPTLAAPPSATVHYKRESPDRIIVTVNTDQPGYVRILEAWDPGWTASLNGEAVEVLCAENMVMAIAVGPGSRELRLRYATPGVVTGFVVALGSLGALVWIAGFRPRLWRHPAAAPATFGSL